MFLHSFTLNPRFYLSSHSTYNNCLWDETELRWSWPVAHARWRACKLSARGRAGGGTGARARRGRGGRMFRGSCAGAVATACPREARVQRLCPSTRRATSSRRETLGRAQGAAIHVPYDRGGVACLCVRRDAVVCAYTGCNCCCCCCCCCVC